MVCSNCSAHLPEDANFCHNCGLRQANPIVATEIGSGQAPILTPNPDRANTSADLFFILEKDRTVDVVSSPELLDCRKEYDRQLVQDCTGEDRFRVYRKALDYARKHKKRCVAQRSFTEEEKALCLNQVYTYLLGEEYWTLIGRLYAMDPERAIQEAKEAVRLRLEAIDRADQAARAAQTTTQPKPRKRKQRKGSAPAETAQAEEISGPTS